MSITYPEYTHSSFPDQLDKQMVIKDPDVDDLALIQAYDSLLAQGKNDAALKLLEDNPQLMDSQFNADKLKRIHHSILALQHFFFDDVREKIYRIGQLKGDWTKTMCTDAKNEDGTEDTENALHMYDIVRYPVRYYNIANNMGIKMSNLIKVDTLPSVGEIDAIYILEVDPSIQVEKASTGIHHECYIFIDGQWELIGHIEDVKQYFMVISNDIKPEDVPTEHPDKYMQMSIKGDRGEPGYTPKKNVDYWDGTPGTGMAPCGAWISTTQYTQYNLVSHNGYLWYTPNENGSVGNEPSIDSTDWIRLDISLQLAVGADAPFFLEEGGLWLHVQNDGHVILRTKDENGTFTVFYPETKAKYIFDETGENLQKKIYQHYFDRDDVKIIFKDNDPVYTMEAKLLNNPDITVAKATLTEDDNGVQTEDFVTYDETGYIVTYHCKKIYEQDGNQYIVTPENLAEDYNVAGFMTWHYM